MTKEFYIDCYPSDEGARHIPNSNTWIRKISMTEWTSLQTPSNEKYCEWVKPSERLPEEEGDYVCRLKEYRGVKEVRKVEWYEGKSYTEFWENDVEEWLDESTPIPILTPCGWVKVEDGLPNEKQLCLVFNSISVEPSVYDRNEFYRYPNDVSGDRCALYHFDKSKVTHWMPLPTKPNL